MQNTKNKWALKALLVALVGCMGSHSVSAFVTTAPRMLPTEYIPLRSMNPNWSPFGQNWDVAPLLDFRIWQQKEELKTSEELNGYGCRIFQGSAINNARFEKYDPMSGVFCGIEHVDRQYQYSLGCKEINWGWDANGEFYYTEGVWDGSDSTWNRKQCGKATIFKEHFNYGGYDCRLERMLTCEWYLSNLRPGPKSSEFSVCYKTFKYPYGLHRWDAAAMGQAALYGFWRVYRVNCGATQDITPTEAEISQNWENEVLNDGTYQAPYLDLSFRRLASYHSLPEWVEGWE